jgi:peptide/nickel transport system substrate-binding protein
MFNHKRWAIIAIVIMIAAVALAACQPETVEKVVEVTRVVTEEVEVQGETVEVTRVVIEEVEVPVEVPVEAEEEVMEEGPKSLVVCMAQEPETLYFYGGSMLVQSAVQHGFYEDPYTTLSYGYQASGLEKLPSIADGDAVVASVEVNAGDTVVDVTGEPVTLEAGITVQTSDGEEVEYDGEATIMMDQLTLTSP